MNYVNDETVFEAIKLKAAKFFSNSQLPGNVFKLPLRHFVFFDFHEIFTDLFYERLTRYLKNRGERSFTFMVADPDPDLYYRRWFSEYSVILVDQLDAPSVYTELVQHEPPESPADGIRYNSTIVQIFGETDDWAIYCDRDFELGIFSSADESEIATFSDVCGSEFVFDAQAAVSDVFELIWREVGMPEEVRNEFLANYQVGPTAVSNGDKN